MVKTPYEIDCEQIVKDIAEGRCVIRTPTGALRLKQAIITRNERGEAVGMSFIYDRLREEGITKDRVNSKGEIEKEYIPYDEPFSKYLMTSEEYKKEAIGDIEKEIKRLEKNIESIRSYFE